MSAAQSALEARSLDVIQCEDKSGQFICYRSGQIYLLTTVISAVISATSGFVLVFF